MNIKINMVLFFFIFSASSKAQFGNPSNLPNAVTNTVAAALHSWKRSDVPKDSISGICSYRGGSCIGAQIVLYKVDKPIFETTLTSITPFKIPGLKSRESYILKLVWEKHKLREEKVVETGEYVEIHLSDKKI